MFLHNNVYIMYLNLVTQDLTSGFAGADASTISNVPTPAYGEGRDDRAKDLVLYVIRV